MSMRNAAILLVSSFWLLASTAYAAPAITGATGVFANLSTVTVSGSGFGTKSPVAPMLWTQFEDGVHAAALPTVATWTAYNGTTGGLFDNTSSYSGTLAAYQKYIYTSPNGENTSNFIFSEEQDEIYYTYRMRGVHAQGTPIGGEGQKSGRITGTGNFYNQAGVLALSYNAISYSPADNVSVPVANNYWNGSDNKGTQSPRWQRHELYKKNSTPGVADGAAWVNVHDGQANPDSNTYWSSSVNGHSATNVITRAEGETFKHNSIWLGLSFTNSGIDSSHEIWIDDVYVDNTQARIELCTGSTWVTRTHCEPQIPKTTWGDTSLNFTLNQGTLEDGSDVYLYVVDASGAVSDPVQLTLGTSDASTDFTPPVTSHNGTSRSATTQSVSLAVNETATTQYCTGSAACTPSTPYSAPISVKPGKFLCFKSTDSAANVEATKCFNPLFPIKCN